MNQKTRMWTLKNDVDGQGGALKRHNPGIDREIQPQIGGRPSVPCKVLSYYLIHCSIFVAASAHLRIAQV
jgi:hypothetical protein